MGALKFWHCTAKKFSYIMFLACHLNIQPEMKYHSIQNLLQSSNVIQDVPHSMIRHIFTCPVTKKIYWTFSNIPLQVLTWTLWRLLFGDFLRLTFEVIFVNYFCLQNLIFLNFWKKFFLTMLRSMCLEFCASNYLPKLSRMAYFNICSV